MLTADDADERRWAGTTAEHYPQMAPMSADNNTRWSIERGFYRADTGEWPLRSIRVHLRHLRTGFPRAQITAPTMARTASLRPIV